MVMIVVGCFMMFDEVEGGVCYFYECVFGLDDVLIFFLNFGG